MSLLLQLLYPDVLEYVCVYLSFTDGHSLAATCCYARDAVRLWFPHWDHCLFLNASCRLSDSALELHPEPRETYDDPYGSLRGKEQSVDVYGFCKIITTLTLERCANGVAKPNLLRYGVGDVKALRYLPVCDAEWKVCTIGEENGYEHGSVELEGGGSLPYEDVLLGLAHVRTTCSRVSFRAYGTSFVGSRAIQSCLERGHAGLTRHIRMHELFMYIDPPSWTDAMRERAHAPL